MQSHTNKNINNHTKNSMVAAIIETIANPEDIPDSKNTNLLSGFILVLNLCTYNSEELITIT